MEVSERCPRCRTPVRQEKTIGATGRPAVTVYVCDGCAHAFLVHAERLALTRLLAGPPPLPAT